MYDKFQLHPLVVLIRRFLIFFKHLPFMSPRQPIKLSDLDKSHMKHGGLLNKKYVNFFSQISPMRQQKFSISTFPIMNLWELLVCIATRVLIRLEQNTIKARGTQLHRAINNVRCEGRNVMNKTQRLLLSLTLSHRFIH